MEISPHVSGKHLLLYKKLQSISSKNESNPYIYYKFNQYQYQMHIFSIHVCTVVGIAVSIAMIVVGDHNRYGNLAKISTILHSHFYCIKRSNCPNGAAVWLYFAGIIFLVSAGKIKIFSQLPIYHSQITFSIVLNYLFMMLLELLDSCECCEYSDGGCADFICNCFFKSFVWLYTYVAVLAVLGMTLLVRSIMISTGQL